MRAALALSWLLLLACDSTPEAVLPARMKVAIGAAPVLGPADAWVTVVVFSDLECPYCAAQHPVLVQLQARYPADVRLAWKHFPLPASIHPHARAAAIATECAKAQGRFWEMADIVFQHRTALQGTDLTSYALQAGCDGVGYTTCVASAEPAAAVDADLAQGRSLGVPGTPTMAVNGTPFYGTADLATLQAAVESARAAAVASGVDRSVYYQQVVLGP